MSCLRRLVSLLFSFVDITVVVVSLLYYYKWNLNTINHYLLDFSFTGSLLDLTLLPLLRWSLFSGGFIASIVNPREARERCEKWKTCVLVCAFVQAYYPLIKLLLMSDVSSFVDFSNSPHFLVLISWNVLAPAVFYLQWKSLCVYVVTLRRFVDERQNLLNKENDHHFYGGINSSIDANEENPPINDESSSVDDEDDDSANIEKKKANFYRILAFTKPDWLLMVFATIFLSLAALAEAVLPLYYGKVISLIIIKKDGETLTNNIIWMIIFSLAASGFAGCRGGLMSVINFRTILRIRQAFFDSITSQEIAFFDEMKTGEIMSRLVSDTTNLGSCLGLNINIFLRTTIKILAACGFMFSLSWRMALVTLLGIPLVSAIAKVYGIYYEKLQKEVQDANALSNEVAGEVFASMQTVRSFANEKTEQKRYGLKLHQVYLIKLKQSICYAGFIWSNELLQLLPKVMIMFYGGYLIYNDLLLPESFMSFIIYQQDISQGFIDMASVYTGLMQALGAGDKVFQLIERQPKMKLDDGQVTSSEVKGHIKFDRVSFTYPTRPEEPILKNLSFEACPGEVVALVGPSGGGKSSCVKLLKRFYQPSSGRITLDGVSVHDFQHDYFHRTVTMVGQEPVLFARSISDNIVYGLDDVTTHEIVESARQANAHNFITSLEAKYDTEAGEKGAQLSGGQKQRIAIARALVRHPRVILLDEATSALDTESEFAVQQALEGNRGNRTVLLIAHRLSSVKRADRIIVIMDGCAVETGTHHQLIQKQGVYYHLVKRQSDEATKEVEDISSPAPTCGHLKWPQESDDEPPLAGGMLSTSPTRIFTKPSSPNNHK